MSALSTHVLESQMSPWVTLVSFRDRGPCPRDQDMSWAAHLPSFKVLRISWCKHWCEDSEHMGRALLTLSPQQHWWSCITLIFLSSCSGGSNRTPEEMQLSSSTSLRKFVSIPGIIKNKPETQHFARCCWGLSHISQKDTQRTYLRNSQSIMTHTALALLTWFYLWEGIKEKVRDECGGAHL